MTLFLVVTTSLLAQNNTNSPYTRFGYGELVDAGLSAHKSMGGIAFGVRTPSGINPANPASYTSADSLSFLFDFGAGGRLSHFSQTDGLKKTTFTGNIDHIALAFPITKWMAISGGILPYSTAGYSFSMRDSVESFPDSKQWARYSQSFIGYGGINQVYLGLGAKFFNRVAIGVNVSYMFGYLTNAQTLTFESAGIADSYRNTEIRVGSINLRYGLQTFHTFNQAHTVTLGGIFEMKSNLNGNAQIDITDIKPDTLDKKFEIPMIYGAGLSYSYKNRLMVGVDFMQQRWSDALFFGVKDSLHNRTKLAIGGEYRHNPVSKRFLERLTYRAGLNYATSYILQSGGDMSVSLGFGIPLRTTRTILNVGFEYGRMGLGAQRSIKEELFKINLGVALNEFWFYKRKFE